jgi:hypothetical protein
MCTQRWTRIPWFGLVTIAAVTTIVIAFGRFRSKERVAQAIASGVVRRRSELWADIQPNEWSTT